MVNLTLTTPNGENVYKIVGYIDDGSQEQEYLDNRGYLDSENRIWIYDSDPKPVTDYPWFKKDVDGNIEYSIRTKKQDMIFKRRNCVNLDVEDIIRNIDLSVKEYEKQPVPIDEEAPMNIVNESDFVFTQLIKHLLNETRVDLTALGAELGETQNLNNLKSSLKRSDVSHKLFAKWCSILGLTYTVILEDDGNSRPVLGGDKLVYQLSTNSVSKIPKKEES